jgi:diguanylate cyclase (GGDEF)-like protein
MSWRLPTHAVAGRRPAVLLLSLVLVAGAGPAAALDPHKAIPQFIHDAWEIEDGLPQNSVADIVQDAEGYLWLATREGLVRFDGVQFTIFDKTNTDAIRSNAIRALYLDEQHVLWIGTYEGLVRREKDTFTVLGREAGLTDTRIWDVAGSPAAGIWVATEAGLYRLRDGAFTRFTTENGLAGDDVRVVHADADGQVWAGTMNGLSCLRDGVFRTYTTRDGLAHDKVKSLYRDRQGRLWVGTHTGVSRLDGDAFTTFGTGDGLVHDSVIGIFEDTAGSMWFGTEGGLSRWVDGRFSSFTVGQGLTQNTVRSFFEDPEGSLWIGTDTGGLNRLREGKFTPYTRDSGLPGDLIWSFYETRDGRLLIGSSEGLIVKDGEAFTLHRRDTGASNNSMAALHQSADGTIWAGTRGDGLYVFADGAFRGFPGREQLARDYVHALAEDGEGSLWIGTRAGLRRLRDGAVTSYTQREGLAGDEVRAILPLPGGALWIGTGTGLSLFRDGTFTNFTTAEGLSSDAVFALHRDADGTLWLGTYGGGLNRYRDGTFRHVTSRDGLYDDVVYVILEDAAGRLWMSGNKGVFHVWKRDFDDRVAGRSGDVRSSHYGVAEGMKSRECNGGLQWAGFETADGRMWFPTIRGAVSVDPRRLPRNRLPPPVHVERLIVDGQGLPPGRREIAPGAQKLEFHYTGLSYAVPDQVQFRYKLEGYDDEWVEAGTRRVAYYTNLPPGNYTFRVRASNNDGVWNESGASLTFVKQPFFWQTAWFAVCVTLLTGVGLFAAHRRRIRRLRRRQRELQALVDLRTQELREASLCDALTGLRNRRFVQEIIRPETAVLAERRQYVLEHDTPPARTGDRWVGVFLVDVDHFKEINDTEGHEAGDRVLQQIGQLLTRAVRKDDVVVRWGGEEFLVVLRHTDWDFLVEFGSRVRRQVAEADLVISDHPRATLRRTCSVGYAPFPFHRAAPQALSFEQVVMLADLGLYHAKRSGRDCAVGVLPGDAAPRPADVPHMVKSLGYATSAGLVQLAVDRATEAEPVGA